MKNKFLTRDDLIKLDQELKMVPLTLDLMFKNIFTYDLEILKEFLILETGLDLDPSKTNITLLNNELPKENIKEYQKTIDIYVTLNEKISIDVELNDSNYNDSLALRNQMYESKLFTLMLEKGEKVDKLLDKKLIQLNLNTKDYDIPYGDDILMTYGMKSNLIYVENKKTILKYLAYYKRLYYNLSELNKAELWLVAILSESLCELYDLLGKLLTDEKRDKFIRKVIEMSEDTFILHEWEKEKMDELKELAIRKDALDEGHELGTEQAVEKIAKNMLQKNISIDLISECTGLTLDEINTLKNNEKN